MSQTVAVIADIHANLFALEATLDHMRQHRPEEIIVAGDMIGRGPQGSAVLARVRDLGYPCLRGNHEDYILNFHHKNVPQEWLEIDEWSASRWMAAELDPAHVPFLDALPMTLTAGGPSPLRLYHGSPVSYQDGIGDWTPEETLRAHLDAVEEDVLVCAHTHRPLHWAQGPRQIVNVGSVGIPFNGDWRAQYATFHRDSHADPWQVRFHQVPWDRDGFLRHYETSGFLEEGGPTSWMLREEIRHARPYLVPFLVWGRAHGRPFHLSEAGDFLEAYREAGSSRELMKSLKALLAQAQTTP